MTSPKRSRRRLIAVALVSALLVGAASTVVLVQHRPTDRLGSAPAGPAGPPTPNAQTAPSLPEQVTRQQRTEIEAAIARLHAMPTVTESTSAEHPPVSAEARMQPDLYAEAFARQLLTQDYRSNREALLAWVQSESAQSTEPTVVGLTPPGLRHKMAIGSVQDASAGPTLIPSPAVWATLGDLGGYTTVRIQRVFTPPTWTAAVAAGKISDPGAAAREVDAEITLHTVDEGRPKTSVYSVALTMNLEGPPTRENYGFVTAVTYHVVDGE